MSLYVIEEKTGPGGKWLCLLRRSRGIFQVAVVLADEWGAEGFHLSQRQSHWTHEVEFDRNCLAANWAHNLIYYSRPLLEAKDSWSHKLHVVCCKNIGIFFESRRGSICPVCWWNSPGRDWRCIGQYPPVTNFEQVRNSPWNDNLVIYAIYFHVLNSEALIKTFGHNPFPKPFHPGSQIGFEINLV